ncbi:MAG: response regulator [Acidobacteria bacterium]|nr:response regulator [Acidobacteriota bacterium]
MDTTPHVLVVDDEEQVRRLLKRWIEAEGLSVTEAGNTDDALRVAATSDPPAVIFCDIRMPGRDGIWLAGEFNRRWPDTPVVLVSGVQEFGAVLGGLRAGVFEYVVKPYQREEIVAILRRALIAHRVRTARGHLQERLAQQEARLAEALVELELNASNVRDAIFARLAAHDPQLCQAARRASERAVHLALAAGLREPLISDAERGALLRVLARAAGTSGEDPNAVLPLLQRLLPAASAARLVAQFGRTSDPESPDHVALIAEIVTLAVDGDPARAGATLRPELADALARLKPHQRPAVWNRLAQP